MVIAVVVGGTAAAFGYTAGWFSPDRITPNKVWAASTWASPTRGGGCQRAGTGLSVQVKTLDGGEWRSAMIDLPFFPVATPEAFFGLLQAGASKDPGAMPRFAAAHPELGSFGA